MASFKLSGGRALDYISNDVDSEVGILFHHGTPGECTGWQKWFSELTEINLDITQAEWREIYINIILVKLIFINGELVENPDWIEQDFI